MTTGDPRCCECGAFIYTFGPGPAYCYRCNINVALRTTFQFLPTEDFKCTPEVKMGFTIREDMDDTGRAYVRRENLEEIVGFLIKHMCSLEQQGASRSGLTAAIRLLSEAALSIKMEETRKVDASEVARTVRLPGL